MNRFLMSFCHFHGCGSHENIALIPLTARGGTHDLHTIPRPHLYRRLPPKAEYVRDAWVGPFLGDERCSDGWSWESHCTCEAPSTLPSRPPPHTHTLGPVPPAPPTLAPAAQRTQSNTDTNCFDLFWSMQCIFKLSAEWWCYFEIYYFSEIKKKRPIAFGELINRDKYRGICNVQALSWREEAHHHTIRVRAGMPVLIWQQWQIAEILESWWHEQNYNNNKNRTRASAYYSFLIFIPNSFYFNSHIP